MKEFVKNEIRKALKRLRGSFVFIVKVLFVATVNLLFWIFPLIFIGYFTLKPMILGLGHHFSDEPTSPIQAYSPSQNSPPIRSSTWDMRGLLYSLESFLRERRFFKRS